MLHANDILTVRYGLKKQPEEMKVIHISGIMIQG